MPQAVTTENEFLHDVRAATVYLKDRWQDDWVEQSFLWPDFLTFTASPQIPSAGFSWRYGEGMRQGESEYSEIAPLDPAGKWVKVSIAQAEGEDPILWYGRILEDVRNADGATFNLAEWRVPHGESTYVAYGMEYLLMREPIRGCYYLQEDGSELELGRALEINPDTPEGTGNCSMGFGPRGIWIFAPDYTTENAQGWSTRNAVKYLLKYHTPTDAENTQIIPWKIDDLAKQVLPVEDWPRVQLHGRTVKSVLDELIDRRRLMGYTVKIDPDDEQTCLVVPFTYTDVPIELPGGGEVIQPNDSQKALDVDRSIDVDLNSIRKSATQVYDQVIAYGDRVVCCGTFSLLDYTLWPDWTPAHQAEYNAGCPDIPADSDRDQEMNLHRDYRAGERFQRVYRYFKIDEGWNGAVGDGEGNAEGDYLFPTTKLNVDLEKESTWYMPELRILSSLPLKESSDYSGSNIDRDTVTTDAPEGAARGYLRPLVYLKQLDSLYQNIPSQYVQVEKMAACAEIPDMGDGEGRKWSCQVQSRPNAPGLIITVQGAPKYAIAAGDFTGTATDDLGYVYDYAQGLMATVALRADYHVRQVWPLQQPPQVDALRVLRIDASAIAPCEYVAPNTVVGLNSIAQPLRTTEGGFLKDPRNLLSDLARLAWEWYGTERQTLAFGCETLTNILSVGDLIVTIGADETLESIRTVVTEARYQFAGDDGEISRTTFRTQWAELDVLQLARQNASAFGVTG